MKFDIKYVISPLLIILGIFLAAVSKVIFSGELNSFWRILIELGGYALIAAGVGVFGVLKNEKT